jgi:hypothetical protein
MRKPDFFIVGAPKCGTTAMYEYLRQHPEVLMPRRKEIPFFGSDLSFSRRSTTDMEEYLSHFSEAMDEKRVGTAFVWYLYSKRAATEIKEFCPTASIIIMLRNPVGMLHSQHSQFLYNGNEDIADFEDALDAEEDRKQGLRVPNNVLLIEGLFYRETVKYTQQVQRYLDAFGWENVHFIIFDDFRSDTVEVYKKTLRFLGVDEDFQPALRIVNPNKRVRSKTLQNPPQIAKGFGKVLTPRPIRSILLKGLKRYNTKYVPRPPMDPELRRRLQAEFVSEVEQLSELLSRDLTHWSQT